MSRETVSTRCDLPIRRTHQRFLSRKLCFTQQYAGMYRFRLEALQPKVLEDLHKDILPYESEEDAKLKRVLDLSKGKASFCVGVVFKNMVGLPRFLKLYEKERCRIVTGAGDEDGGGEEMPVVDIAEEVEDDDTMILDEGTTTTTADNNNNNNNNNNGNTSGAANNANGVSNGRRLDVYRNVCAETDELYLEDSSGRILLEGLDAGKFCTGMVIGVYGELGANGSLQVKRYTFPTLWDLYVDRNSSLNSFSQEPCFIAFVGGLNINLESNACEQSSTSKTLLIQLIDFLCGNIGDEEMQQQAAAISRLVIGGNNITFTDELQLKLKVKLDSSDHARLSHTKPTSTSVSSAKLMLELDKVLSQLVECIEVDLMPGNNDMSNAFYPQQPLHPVLLPNAGRYSTLKLVTNPYEFSTETQSGDQALTIAATKFFVTSGQNVNDAARQTTYESRVDLMGMLLQCGCVCPTAPNTLHSYPFYNEDPFVFRDSLPHCFVACDQPRFETRFESLDILKQKSRSYLSHCIKEEGNGEGKFKPDCGVRLVCVPPFSSSGTLVLIDVNSPTLEPTVITFKSP